MCISPVQHHHSRRKHAKTQIMSSPARPATNYNHSYHMELTTILTDNSLCSSKQQVLHRLYAKYKYWTEATNLSSYYSRALEVIKHILQHISNNDTYIKQNIKFYNRNEEYVTHLGEILGEATLYVFDSIDDDIVHDIDEGQITTFVGEIEERTTELLVHHDFHEFIMSAYDEEEEESDQPQTQT